MGVVCECVDSSSPNLVFVFCRVILGSSEGYVGAGLELRLVSGLQRNSAWLVPRFPGPRAGEAHRSLS